MMLSESVQKLFSRVGATVPRLLLPGEQAELEKFAVIACDQHSAEPDYWEAVEKTVGGAPSALRLMLPEAWLNRPDKTAGEIVGTMRRYLQDGTLRDLGEGLICPPDNVPAGFAKA